MIIYGIVGAGFGDMWASLHWCLNLPGDRDPLIVSTLVGTDPYTDQHERLAEMLAQIDSTRSLQFTSAPANLPIVYECWTTKYLPTKQRWAASTSLKGLISYQFDGRSSADAKNPPMADADLFHEWIRAGGLNAVRIGLPFSMADCIRLLCLSEVFVGSCSGMSTLALSVGVPVHVMAYSFGPSYWYGPNHHNICANLAGFMRDYDDSPESTADDPWGTWLMESGSRIAIKRGGGALWFDTTHSVPGVWKESPLLIHWSNGFRYSLELTAPNRSRITQHSPEGSTSCCFASRE